MGAAVAVAAAVVEASLSEEMRSAAPRLAMAEVAGDTEAEDMAVGDMAVVVTTTAVAVAEAGDAASMGEGTISTGPTFTSGPTTRSPSMMRMKIWMTFLTSTNEKNKETLTLDEQMDIIRSRVGRVLLGPNRQAAMNALYICLREPGSLVRVTFTDVEQVSETIQTIMNGMVIIGCLDTTSRNVATEEKHPILEMTNGSAIEFCFDKSARK